mgnify:CR=1 FL=1
MNGNAQAPESDSHKDLVGRVSYTNQWANNQFSTAVSTYQGGVRQSSKFDYRPDGSRAAFVLKDTSTAIGGYATRQYFGWDGQFSHVWRPGTTTLRLEIVGGTQAGTATSDESPKTKDGLTGDLYERPMLGGTAYFIQNLGKSNFQFVVKYDFFDGNAHTSGDEIGLSLTKTGVADLRYDTWGIGLNFYYRNLTTMLYYDIVKNETSANLPGYKKDLKDNFLTVRAQVKF